MIFADRLDRLGNKMLNQFLVSFSGFTQLILSQRNSLHNSVVIAVKLLFECKSWTFKTFRPFRMSTFTFFSVSKMADLREILFYWYLQKSTNLISIVVKKSDIQSVENTLNWYLFVNPSLLFEQIHEKINFLIKLLNKNSLAHFTYYNSNVVVVVFSVVCIE